MMETGRKPQVQDRRTNGARPVQARMAAPSAPGTGPGAAPHAVTGPGTAGGPLPRMGAAPRIRPLEAADRADWDRLWTAYLDFYETQLPMQVYDITFQRLLDPDPASFRCLIAEAEGQPRGLVHFVFHPHCWRMDQVCYLQDLYVDPGMRGTGLGRMLIEAVYAAADAEGAPQVYWMTQDFNAAARQLYDRIGQVTPFVKYIRS